VLNTRAETIGFSVAHDELNADTAAVLVQYPDTKGVITDHSGLIAKAKSVGAKVIFSCDPLALLMLQAPGDLGADIAVGSIQRFGVPMGNGGPHAAFLACTQDFLRTVPGRIVGQSIDAKGRPAYRLTLQTREQHIRREKATSNICTAQALLANMAVSYAIWHGPDGLLQIASQIHDYACSFAAALRAKGYELAGESWFDTITVDVGDAAQCILAEAEANELLLRDMGNGHLSVAFDEISDDSVLEKLCAIFKTSLSINTQSPLQERRDITHLLSQPVFHEKRSETEMMRYLRSLMDKDLALDKAMIPLGSCTMKLNAVAEMMPVSWPEVSNVHPLSPEPYRAGYNEMIADLDRWLQEITGFAKVSFQPNAGSQGEYAGLLAIRSYHEAHGQGSRDVCLIPTSAHGTNPASAQMIGYQVVAVKCLDNGDIDLADLKEKAIAHADRLAALMITYPSTHGVFEDGVGQACTIVHDHGGQVYLDGANLNALVGLARPGDFGADVCHMNLHKTFCIPHGGGGPGVGPIGVAKHLVPHLCGHVHYQSSVAVSAAPEGSASILPISWMYIRMLGGDGLKYASEIAILSANYLAERLKKHYPVLFTGSKGTVAHECILDTRVLKDESGISVDDIAKRLIDYGFHAPTMSWPVIGTLMVEPTESEPLKELDRFADAMIAIRLEADNVKAGDWPADDNPLVNAPHTAEDLMASDWSHPYERMLGGFPSGVAKADKFWPPVGRVDNAYGDKNVVCTCPPVEDVAVNQ
jgi:glycine dehydrogenase